jgi:hypothetical protein
MTAFEFKCAPKIPVGVAEFRQTQMDLQAELSWLSALR